MDGSTYAGAQWQRFMQDVAKDYNTSKFTKPSEKVLEGKNGTTKIG